MSRAMPLAGFRPKSARASLLKTPSPHVRGNSPFVLCNDVSFLRNGPSLISVKRPFSCVAPGQICLLPCQVSDSLLLVSCINPGQFCIISCQFCNSRSAAV